MCVCPAAYELGVDGKQCYREYDLRLDRPCEIACNTSHTICAQNKKRPLNHLFLIMCCVNYRIE